MIAAGSIQTQYCPASRSGVTVSPMTHGYFLWTDLSTYDQRAARRDYEQLFGWRFRGSGDYQFATAGGHEVAAIFTMPDRLAAMQMPSFWMSYVHVDNLQASVEKARLHKGVVIEVEPQAFNDEASIALVRDPSGAGFTLYDGPPIGSPNGGAGHVDGRYYHGPDITLIAPFYDDLFGWRFEKTHDDPWPTYSIIHPDGLPVATAECVPETMRGKYRYWMPSFTVASASNAQATLEKLNGTVLFDLTEGRSLVADRQGAHFILHEQPASDQTASPGSRPIPSAVPATPSGGFPWKALLGLVCIWLAVFLDLQAFWGVLFLIWTWPAIRSGRADFVEPVSRALQPVLYWALVGTWVLLSVWLIVGPLLTPV